MAEGIKSSLRLLYQAMQGSDEASSGASLLQRAIFIKDQALHYLR